MEKFILMIFVFTILASCGGNKKEYLYDKYDGQDYQAALGMKQKECETKNKIFSILDKYSNFDQIFGADHEKIIRIRRKKNGSDERSIFIYFSKDEYDETIKDNKSIKLHITSFEATTMDPVVNKIVTYTQKQNKDIIGTIMTGVCSHEAGLYSLVGGWSTAQLVYRDVREVKRNNNKDYDKVDETLTALPGYPALFTRWIGTTTREKKEGNSKATTKYELSGKDAVKLISHSECIADSTCKKLFDGTVSFKSCDPIVDKTHYRATSPDSQLVSFSCSEVNN